MLDCLFYVPTSRVYEIQNRKFKEAETVQKLIMHLFLPFPLKKRKDYASTAKCGTLGDSHQILKILKGSLCSMLLISGTCQCCLSDIVKAYHINRMLKCFWYSSLDCNHSTEYGLSVLFGSSIMETHFESAQAYLHLKTFNSPTQCSFTVRAEDLMKKWKVNQPVKRTANTL